MKLKLLCLALLAGLIATGCSSRVPSKDYILTVTSTKEDVEYTLSGTVDIDGVKTQVTDTPTPYRFVGKGVTINATLTSHDPDCQIKASIDASGLRDLNSSISGPAGAVVTVRTNVIDRDMSLEIAVKPFKVKSAAMKPAEVKPVEDKPAEAKPAEAKPMEPKPTEAAEPAPAVEVKPMTTTVPTTP